MAPALLSYISFVFVAVGSTLPDGMARKLRINNKSAMDSFMRRFSHRV